MVLTLRRLDESCWSLCKGWGAAGFTTGCWVSVGSGGDEGIWW